MKHAKSVSLLAAVAASALTVSACVTHSPHYRSYGYGHSHGYAHYNRDLRYDNHLGVYVVVGRPHYYYHNDHYYRYNGGRWYSSRQMSGNWRDYDYRKLPPGLAKKYGHDNRKDKRKRRQS